jgi:hypothetical protein
MPKRPSKDKRRRERAKRIKDFNQLAKFIVDETTTEPPVDKDIISKVMSQMGKKGGKKSGALRMENIPPEKRSEIALKAARARWDKVARRRG